VSAPSTNSAVQPERRASLGVETFSGLGGAVLFFFCVQVLTGIPLLIYYRPSAEAAFASLGIIMDEVRLGWLVRSVHFWSANLLILCGLLHLINVYFRRTYVAPRRTAWVTGILLFVVILGFGLTGTLLPWDQYAYWEIDAARETIVSIPFVGGTLLGLFWGGWEIGQEVLLRFYAFHVGILPWLALAWLSLHVVVVWRARQAEAPMVPRLVASPVAVLDRFIALVLISGGLLTLAILFPPELAAPADPMVPLVHVQPRWYLLPARQLLRHLSGGVASLVILGLFALVLSVPFIDRSVRPSRAGRAMRWVLGIAAVAAWILLAVRQYRS
jgi:quinol-cytochrome oxidoreductase complex cytochrome b subunit